MEPCGRIQTNVPNTNWRYCPTLENPADLFSRGTTTHALMLSELWQHGPEWLTSPSLWPSSELPTLSPLLVAAATATEFIPTGPTQPDVGLHCVIAINRHSTLGKLLTVTAYVYHFVRNLRTSSERRQTGPVSADELASGWNGLETLNKQCIVQKLPTLSRKQRNLSNMLVRQLRLFLDAKGSWMPKDI